MVKRDNAEHKTHLIAVAGLVVAVLTLLVTILCTIYAVRRSEALARQSGSLAHPDIVVALSGFTLVPNNSLNVAYALPSRDAVTMVPLQLQIKNQGDKDLRHPRVTIRYPSIAKAAVPTDMITMKVAGDYTEGIVRTMSNIQPYDVISFQIPDLRAGQAIVIDEIFHMSPTQVSDSMHIPHLGATVSYSFSYGLNVDIALSGEDYRVQYYPLIISGEIASSPDQLNELRRAEINKTLNKLRQEATLFEYLGLCIRGARDIELRLAPRYTTYTPPVGTVIVPSAEKTSVAVGAYYIATWGRLLK